ILLPVSGNLALPAPGDQSSSRALRHPPPEPDSGPGSTGGADSTPSVTPASSAHPGQGPKERISSRLRREIAASGSADAIILLEDSPPHDGQGGRAAVAAVQDEVLRGFLPGELRGLYRFEMLPALAARLTAAQLARFEASPRVLSVGENLPGTGGMSQS